MTVAQLEKLVTTKTCVGEPIVVGDVTLIPIQAASFGYGSGGGEGDQGNASKGTGGGAGAGVSLKPIAVVAIHGTHVQVFNLGDKNVAGKILEMLPLALSKINIGKKKGDATDEGDAQEACEETKPEEGVTE